MTRTQTFFLNMTLAVRNAEIDFMNTFNNENNTLPGDALNGNGNEIAQGGYSENVRPSSEQDSLRENEKHRDE